MAIAVRPTAAISPQQISKDATGLPQNRPAGVWQPSRTLRRRRAEADGRAPRPTQPEAVAIPLPGTCLNLCEISISVARAQPWHGRSAVGTVPVAWAGGPIGFGFRQNGKAKPEIRLPFWPRSCLLLAPRDRAWANSEKKGAECKVRGPNAAKSCSTAPCHSSQLIELSHFPFAQPVGWVVRSVISSKFIFVPQLLRATLPILPTQTIRTHLLRREDDAPFRYRVLDQRWIVP